MRETCNVRYLAGFASAALNGLLLIALLYGLRANPDRLKGRTLIDVAFSLPIKALPKRPMPHLSAPRSHHRKAASARDRSTPAIPKVARVTLSPPTLPTAKPDSGVSSSQGLGQTWMGDGTGNGTGTGKVDGNGGSEAEWIGGHIDNRDYPDPAADRSAQGTVRTEITVAPNGRASSCRIIQSSGDPDLDATTCRLVIRRFRFQPATDDAGHSVADTVEYDQEWVLSRAADRPASD